MFNFTKDWANLSMRYVTLVSDDVTYEVMIGARNPKIGYKCTVVAVGIEITPSKLWLQYEETKQWETGQVTNTVVENSNV